jgi:hypothetical protein
MMDAPRLDSHLNGLRSQACLISEVRVESPATLPSSVSRPRKTRPGEITSIMVLLGI